MVRVVGVDFYLSIVQNYMEGVYFQKILYSGDFYIHRY